MILRYCLLRVDGFILNMLASGACACRCAAGVVSGPDVGRGAVGVGCHWDFYFRGAIVAAGAGIVGFPAYRCAGGGLGFVVDEGVVVEVPVAIPLAAGRADGLCRASGGAAGMLMQLQHLIRTIIRNSIRGIVGLEAVFIRFFNTVPRYNRHRVPCGGSVCSRDADGCSGQGLFDDDGSESTVVIIQVNIVFASALFTIALPVAGNIDIAANGQSARIRNINTARFSSLCYAVIGNTAAVDANVIAGRVYSSAAFIGVVSVMLPPYMVKFAVSPLVLTPPP